MNPTSGKTSWVDEFWDILLQHLHGDAEPGLERAYNLGRGALASGCGLLEVVSAHSRAVERLTAHNGGTLLPASVAMASGVLAEALAPFEMTLKGYREANAALKRASQVLESRVRERTRELAAAEARFRSLVEHIPAVTYVARDAEQRLAQYFSPQIHPLIGVPPGDGAAIALQLEDFIHPEDRARVHEEWKRSAVERVLFQCEYRLVTPDKRLAWVRDEAALLLPTEGQGQPQRQGILLDITHQRALELQVRHAQKMESIGRLAGGVAHDFNNLLSVILTSSRMVAETLPDGDPNRADMEEIEAAGRRAASLTSQLLAFSHRQVEVERVLDVNHTIRGLERMLARLLGEDVELRVGLAPGPLSVCMDPGQLEQVVVNLAVNARDAMPKGGRLVIESGSGGPLGGKDDASPAQAEHVWFSVSDTGTGMDLDVQARIFEPFFTTKEVGKGTGLGLATCHGIVERVGGRIQVESALGQGTTFRILLPAARRPGKASVPVTQGSLYPGTEHILLVEDDDAVRGAASRILDRCGYQVLRASGGEEALRLLAQTHDPPLKLLISDVVMPGINGVEVARRAVALCPGIKVLLVSGYSDPATLRQGGTVPAFPLLAKPFTPTTLPKRVREVLDGDGRP